MSFSSEQKESIINQNIKSACCRRAFLTGVLFAKGEVTDGEVLLAVERREYAEAISRLVLEFYGKTPEILAPAKGGRCVVIRFTSNSAANYITDLAKRDSLFVEKCSLCTSSFLRGVFIASGRISDPEKQYSLEFSPLGRYERLSEYLKELGLVPRISNKSSGNVVYFKNSSEIEDFLGHANMNAAMFAIIDARFSGEARKNVMRALNCETKNMQKTVNAAVEQNELISALVDANLLSSLPDGLEWVARLRMKYPDYSLSQLAAVATPSISKSGLSHRLKKLMELGKQLLHKS